MRWFADGGRPDGTVEGDAAETGIDVVVVAGSVRFI
jgi:hypothetical protein